MHNKPNIAISGTSGLIGSHLLFHLDSKSEYGKIIAIDRTKPSIKSKNLIFVKTDLKSNQSIKTISDTLKRYKCNTFIHSALPEQPTKNLDEMHEFQVIGSRNILLACEAADVKKIILASTTEVYGALPNNPGFITEERKLFGKKHGPFMKDKVDVENQFSKFQERFPRKTVTILRPCTVLGPTVKNFKVHFFSHSTIPTVLGFDPLIQFVHMSDLLRAFETIIKHNHRGAFNIVGDGVLPLSRVLKIAGKTSIPLLSFFLESATQIAWYLNIAPVPAGHINYIKYQFICDGTKAKKVLKFDPVYSSMEALLSMKQLPNGNSL